MRRHAPATERNRDPILDVLKTIVKDGDFVLEIASGTGQHAAYFGAQLPCTWQPSDREVSESIRAWTEGLPNVRAPLEIDVMKPWPIDKADVVVCINMIHISPWSATLALLDGAARIAPVLFLYGPYKRGGMHTAPSNEAFDRRLREENSEWGVRDLDDVTREASARGFMRERVVEMPANNLSVVFTST